MSEPGEFRQGTAKAVKQIKQGTQKPIKPKVDTGSGSNRTTKN
jgi:hypothetical protein